MWGLKADDKFCISTLTIYALIARSVAPLQIV
jgi:hypothetical protein